MPATHIREKPPRLQAERVVGCLLHFSALKIGQPKAESAVERKAAMASVVRTEPAPPLGCFPLLILRMVPGGRAGGWSRQGLSRFLACTLACAPHLMQ